MSASEKFQLMVDRAHERVDDARRQAAVILHDELVRLCSTQGGPDIPSRPGDPPHRRSGELVSGIFADVQGDAIVLGSHAPYAKYVYAKRPAPKIAWENKMGAISAIIKGT